MLCSYEARLAAEQETGLRLRGELGLLKKRVGGFQGQAEELQAQLQRMHDLEASLHKVHAPLTCTIPSIHSHGAQYLMRVGLHENAGSVPALMLALITFQSI